MFILYCKANLKIESGLACSSIGPGIISYVHRHFTSYSDQKKWELVVVYTLFIKKRAIIQASLDLHLGAIIPFNLRICFIYLFIYVE
jgi:hypothetical protein